MKKLICICIILVTMFFVAADGMMICFNLSRSIQYAFNYMAILFILPATLYWMLEDVNRENI